MIEQQGLFIAVAGNIGAGKSTLTGMLSDAFGWEPFYEANAENPYLSRRTWNAGVFIRRSFSLENG